MCDRNQNIFVFCLKKVKIDGDVSSVMGNKAVEWLPSGTFLWKHDPWKYMVGKIYHSKERLRFSYFVQGT